ncbi:MAG: hypothetical protein HY698_07375 [Deltaproteobacteria bacterium]|nr:hypothetical protein [Deltaproteobacteria bacterium]
MLGSWVRSAGTVAVAVAGLCSQAWAGENDLVLPRLAEVTAARDGVVAKNQEFRSLVSELGVALAPKFLSPADTLGYSGFQFSSELSFTTIHRTESYWCATEETDGCGPSDTKTTAALPTVAVFARKGIWLPLPSFELGAGALHVLDSRMWAAQAYAKLALHEGFHEWPIPSLAVRLAASRLFGSEQLDLTVTSVDVSVSKSFGILGTVSLEPYAGWNLLWMLPRSQVLDKTPETDPLVDTTDARLNFVFPEQDPISRQRFFGGFKLKYYVFAITAEVNVALPGSSLDNRAGSTSCDAAPAEKQNSCDAKDKAGAQQTYALSLSLDF